MCGTKTVHKHTGNCSNHHMKQKLLYIWYTQGSYTCADCPAGYENNGLYNCILTDPCLARVHNCLFDNYCVLTSVGEFKCEVRHLHYTVLGLLWVHCKIYIDIDLISGCKIHSLKFLIACRTSQKDFINSTLFLVLYRSLCSFLINFTLKHKICSL